MRRRTPATRVPLVRDADRPEWKAWASGPSASGKGLRLLEGGRNSRRGRRDHRFGARRRERAFTAFSAREGGAWQRQASRSSLASWPFVTEGSRTRTAGKAL